MGWKQPWLAVWLVSCCVPKKSSAAHNFYMFFGSGRFHSAPHPTITITFNFADGPRSSALLR